MMTITFSFISQLEEETGGGVFDLNWADLLSVCHGLFFVLRKRCWTVFKGV